MGFLISCYSASILFCSSALEMAVAHALVELQSGKIARVGSLDFGATHPNLRPRLHATAASLLLQRMRRSGFFMNQNATSSWRWGRFGRSCAALAISTITSLLAVAN